MLPVETAEMQNEPARLPITNNVNKSLKHGHTSPTPLSKNHLKKLRKLETIAALRKERREKERARRKQKRREAHEQGLQLAGDSASRKALKKKTEQQQKDGAEHSLKVAIDLDYDDVMISRDIAKCVKQCLRIYAINRRSTASSALHFTGIKTNGNIHAAFMRNNGWKNWNVHFHFDKTHCDVFPKNNLIFLTSDSDQTMQRLEPDCTYVVGGLVDHNHQKGLCLERANEMGIRTARLPLDKYVNMKTRSVLTTFHVFEILIRLAEGASWPDAILKTIPMRKGAMPLEVQTEVPADDAAGSHKTDEAVEAEPNDVVSSVQQASAETEHTTGK